METNALDPNAASASKRLGSKSAPGGSLGRKPRDSLNRSVIIEAGLAIVKRNGLASLTFQALGDELGAHATSVYRHFRDKDELLLEIIDTLRENSYGSDLVSTGDWRADLRLIATQIRDHYLRYAPFAHEMSLRSTHRKNEFENVEFALNALDRANLSPDDSVIYLRLIGNYVRAMSSFDASVSCLDPELRAKDYLQMKSASMILEKSDFPHLAESSLKLIAFDDPRIFELGLNAILDAIEALGKSGKLKTK